MHNRYTIAAAAFGIVMSLFASQALAQGEAAAPSLIIPPGARANGMGESHVAVADDATASWWNVGALAFIPNNNLAFMHSQLVPDLASDVYYEFLGYSHEIKGTGVIGFSVIFLTYGTSLAVNDQNVILGEFTSREYSLSGSFATSLGNNLGVGVSMKFIRVDYAPGNLTVEKQNGTGSSFAVDTGLLWRLPSKRLRFGFAVANMGPDIALIDREQSDPLPWTARLGTAWTMVSDDVSNFILAADIEQSLVWLVDGGNRRSEIWHGGVEYRYVNLLSGRMGYIYDDDGDFNSFTWGLGFIYKDKLSLDYANVPQAEELERVHRWSVYFTF